MLRHVIFSMIDGADFIRLVDIMDIAGGVERIDSYVSVSIFVTHHDIT